MYSFLILIFFGIFQSSIPEAESNQYSVSKGVAFFRSEAPQEIISAQSNQLRGIIDLDNKTFVFSVRIRTFNGFNSALQQEHFNEKYLESEKFPEAIFIGKIVEDDDISKEGEYMIRAKGKFQIHGIQQERIIRSTVSSRDGVLHLSCKFNLHLTDYNIKIPKVVHEKIAADVSVEISADLVKITRNEK